MISKTGLHAIRALVALAALPANAYAGAGAIAEKIGAPKNYLSKLLQTLAIAGLVYSQKGLGGGFRLARDPRRITLLEVIEPIEHVSQWSGCILGHENCSEEAPCAIHREWKTARDAYLHLLTETSIADLAESKELKKNPRLRRNTLKGRSMR